MITKIVSAILTLIAAFINTATPTPQAHSLIYYDQSSFYQGIIAAKNTDNTKESAIIGGIVPHHLLPSFIIADFYSRIGQQNPKTIIIIGPNHEEKGSGKVLTSELGWNTPFGIVQPDINIAQELVADNLAKIDESVLPSDHAVAGSMPFIKYYSPNTKVVPILLSNFMSINEDKILADKLTKYLNKDTVIVAAVDFSHYQTSDIAVKNNQRTLNYIENYNFEGINSLNNAYVDSPSSILVFLMSTKSKNAMPDVLYNTNSGEITGNKNGSVTSYFSIIYH